MFSAIRGCLDVFSALRGCLGRILGLLGMLPCFDPTHCLELRLVFGWEMEGFGLVFFIEVVAAIVNLMLDFLIT